MSSVLSKSRAPMRNNYTSTRRTVAKPMGSPRKGRPAAKAVVPKSGKYSGSSMAVALDPQSVQRAFLWLVGLACVLAAFGGLSFGLMKAYQYCVSSEYFKVSTIEVQGTRQLSTAEIIDLSGIHEGDNSLSVHIPEIENKLLQNPWIESVSIKRELPDRFVIEINERIPQFWVLKDGTLHYLDQSGILIAPVESSNFYSLPTLDIGPGGDEALPYLSEFMQSINSVDMPFELSNISWLRISAGKGFELYWENKHLSLSIDMVNWQQNLKRLSLVVTDMEKRGEIAQTREIRAADGQVWLQKS